MKWFERDGRECERVVAVVNPPHVAIYSYQDVCSRCGGAGRSDKWMHTGYTCFECGGHGRGKIRTVKVYSAEKLEKLNASASKRDAKRRAKLAAERSAAQAAAQAWREEHAEALASMAAQAYRSTFLVDLLSQAEGRPLTQKQLDAGAAAAARESEKAEQEKRQEWVARPGARIDFDWTVERVIEISEGGWGSRGFYEAARYLVVGRDAAGNAIKYIGSGRFPHEGETARVRATVKAHDTYNGVKQTVIERPKMSESAC